MPFHSYGIIHINPTFFFGGLEDRGNYAVDFASEFKVSLHRRAGGHGASMILRSA